MQYKILYSIPMAGLAESVENLEKEVNKYLEKGWEPIAGVVIHDCGASFQAIIKK